MKRNVKYIKNYNKKLDCDIFTTIRKYSPEKLKFYRETVNTIFDHILVKEHYCKGKLLSVKLENTDDIPDELIMVDTGIADIKKARKLLENFGCGPTSMSILLTFKRIKQEISVKGNNNVVICGSNNTHIIN